MSDVTLPKLQCATCGADAIGVCNVILQQPMSVPYCRRCVTEGIEAYDVIVSVIYMLLIDADELDVEVPDPVTADFVRQGLASWAVDIIDNSLAFHQKTWDDVLSDAKEDLEHLNEQKPEWATEEDPDA